MSNKKMLTEGTVRRFMKLARVDSLSDRFVNEMYSSPMEEDEDTNEGHCMEEDMMGVSEEDGSLEAGFEGQADADGIETMSEIDYTSHGDVDEGMFDEDMYDEGMEEGMFDEDMYGEGMHEEDVDEGVYGSMEEEEDKLQGEEIFMKESRQRDSSVAWLFEQDEEDEPIEDEEDDMGDPEEDMPMDDEMDDDMGDPEEDMPMDDEMGEADISLTEEEAELLISLGERLKEAMEEGDAGEPMDDEGDITDEMPVGDEDEPVGDEDEEDEPVGDEDDQEEVIQEILRRVTKRVMNQKLRRK